MCIALGSAKRLTSLVSVGRCLGLGRAGASRSAQLETDDRQGEGRPSAFEGAKSGGGAEVIGADRDLRSLMHTPLDSAWIGFSATSYTRAGDANCRLRGLINPR